MKTFFPFAILLVFLGFLIPQAQAQFVENGSFEVYSVCPNCQGGSTITGALGGTDVINDWGDANNTPDYFNECFSSLTSPGLCSNVDVPGNFTNTVSGTLVPAQEGYGYIGLHGKSASREYIQTKLKNSLTAGQTYRLSFYARRAPDAERAFSTVGAALTSTAVSGAVINVTPQAESTSPIGPNSWTLVTNTFVATGNETYLTLGSFGTQTFTSTGIISSEFSNALMIASAYYLFDDVKLCEEPLVPLDANFSVNIFCKNGQISILADANSRYCNHRFELFETIKPCTGDPCLVMPAVATGTRDQVYFFVPYVAGQYYVIKHTVWDACHGETEVRTLIQIPDFQGSITSPSPICENTPVIVTANNINPDPGTPWTLLVEGIVPGSSTGVNPHTYYGCGIPGILDLSSPVASGLYDSPFSSCPPKFSPDGSPYNFTCDANCSYYRLTFSYERCGIPFTAEIQVHLLCAPLLSCAASPSDPCLNDPVVYTAINPTTGVPDPFVTYNWYNGLGQFLSTGPVLGPRNYNPFEGTIAVEAISSDGCVAGCKAGTRMCGSGGGGGNGGGGVYQGGGKRVGASSAAPVQVFPNPVLDQLSIRYDLTTFREAYVTLHDLTGKMVFSRLLSTTETQMSLDLGEMAAGAYILRLTADGQVITNKKLILSK